MIDITPAANTLSHLVRGVEDDRLTAATPCAGMTVGALLDHLDGLSQAFTTAAGKSADGDRPPPSADASRLTPDWRTRIPDRLDSLTEAWGHDDAWQGMTRAGGLDLPAEVAGLVALDELVIHGWDLARATGQQYDVPPRVLEAVHGFVRATASQNPHGTPGLFGPPVAVPDGAPLLDRVIGLSGRDPGWRPDAT